MDVSKTRPLERYELEVFGTDELASMAATALQLVFVAIGKIMLDLLVHIFCTRRDNQMKTMRFPSNAPWAQRRMCGACDDFFVIISVGYIRLFVF